METHPLLFNTQMIVIIIIINQRSSKTSRSFLCEGVCVCVHVLYSLIHLCGSRACLPHQLYPLWPSSHRNESFLYSLFFFVLRGLGRGGVCDPIQRDSTVGSFTGYLPTVYNDRDAYSLFVSIDNCLDENCETDDRFVCDVVRSNGRSCDGVYHAICITGQLVKKKWPQGALIIKNIRKSGNPKMKESFLNVRPTCSIRCNAVKQFDCCL